MKVGLDVEVAEAVVSGDFFQKADVVQYVIVFFPAFASSFDQVFSVIEFEGSDGCFADGVFGAVSYSGLYDVPFEVYMVSGIDTVSLSVSGRKH